MPLSDNTPQSTPGANDPRLDKKSPVMRHRPRSRWQNMRLLIGGLAWALVCYLLIPNWVLSPITSRGHSRSGMPVWSFGILVSCGALFGFTMQRETAFSKWIDRHPWVSLVIILGIIIAWILVFEKK
jgi:cation transport ATPase